MLELAERGEIARLLFAVPAEAGWPLALYELALLTAARLRAVGARTEITLLTPEMAPLAAFGGRASGAVLEDLEDHGIHFIAGLIPEEIAWGELRARPGKVRLQADAVVTLPKLCGPATAGAPGRRARLHPGRRPRPGRRDDECLCGRGRDLIPDQARRARGTAGVRRRGGDRGTARGVADADAVSPRASRNPADRRPTALPGRRDRRQRGRCQLEAVVVAAGQDRRPLPRSISLWPGDEPATRAPQRADRASKSTPKGPPPTSPGPSADAL